MVILYTSNKGNFINLKNITISEMESKGIKKNIYVNLTNRCPCACTFCLRATKKMSETNSLWLEKEPTAEEVITEFENIDINLYDEIIFCGFGEPTERLDAIIEISKYIKKRNPNMLNNFIQRWIPLEELYFNAFSVQDKCNILIDTSKA